jgi:hypothetical protein
MSKTQADTADLRDRGDRTNAVPYYVALGKGCDAIVRCKDCQHLVTHALLMAKGSCPRCGNRRVTEVRALGLWEWLRIRLGLLDFPYRKEFLKEFARG